MRWPSPNVAFRAAALLGLLAVACGAFGAHALKEWLVRQSAVEIWEKAVFYHLTHAVMMILLPMIRPYPRAAWVAFGLGVLGFSGSLYLYALCHVVWLMYITPFGGLGLLTGWLLLVIRRTDPDDQRPSPTTPDQR